MNIKAWHIGLLGLYSIVCVSASANSATRADAARSISLYTQPSTSSEQSQIRVLPDQMTVVSLGQSWMKVRPNTPINLWIDTQYLAVVGDTVVISKSEVSAFLENPDLAKSQNMFPLKLRPNTQYKLLEQIGKWVKIESNGNVEFWVSSKDYLSATIDNKKIKQSQSENMVLANTKAEGSAKDIRPSVEEPIEQSAPPFLNWLCSLPGEQKTLQLASFKNVGELDKYVEQHPSINNNKLHRATSLDKNWHYLLYGSFDDIELATVQRQLLGLDSSSARVRSIKILQSKRCDKLSLAGR